MKRWTCALRNVFRKKVGVFHMFFHPFDEVFSILAKFLCALSRCVWKLVGLQFYIVQSLVFEEFLTCGHEEDMRSQDGSTIATRRSINYRHHLQKKPSAQTAEWMPSTAVQMAGIGFICRTIPEPSWLGLFVSLTPTMFDHVLLMVWSFFIMCDDVWVCFNYICLSMEIYRLA